jgi:hypothetical protein
MTDIAPGKPDEPETEVGNDGQSGKESLPEKSWKIFPDASPLFFYSLFFTFSLITGTFVWLHSQRASIVMAILFSGFALWWIARDAIRCQVRIGSYIPVVAILFQPLGMLMWFIKTRKGKGISAFAMYVVIMAISCLVSFIGYVLFGIIKGYSLQVLISG